MMMNNNENDINDINIKRFIYFCRKQLLSSSLLSPSLLQEYRVILDSYSNTNSNIVLQLNELKSLLLIKENEHMDNNNCNNKNKHDDDDDDFDVNDDNNDIDVINNYNDNDLNTFADTANNHNRNQKNNDNNDKYKNNDNHNSNDDDTTSGERIQNLLNQVLLLSLLL